MTENFVGYDISPDMVRLSLVNMYLHHFPKPTIFAYDTLGSDDRWDDYFDVILANPPFMSPKGGIPPHSRFAIQSKRSEVLFVDYIAEHLNPDGKAGIIVPEGIIFQSSNSYKALRKMLVDEGYLWAVVSLPSGVFNPYSGVKTSILLIDKTLAKRRERVLFVEIKNDGRDLGAQRRKIAENDLPTVLQLIQAWQTKPSAEIDSPLAYTVLKTKIAEDGDYNLSGGRYRETKDLSKVTWPLTSLGEVITLEYGKGLKKDERKGGDYPVFGSNGIVGYHNEYLVEGPFIIVGRKGSAGEVTFSEQSGFPIDTTFFVHITDKSKLDLKYIYHILRKLNLGEINVQAGVPGLNRNDAYKIKIPLPPLDVQRAIVEEIESYQVVIDGARQVVENYSPRLPINPDWEMKKLGDICKTSSGGTPLRSKAEYYDNGTIPWLRSGEVDQGYITKSEKLITKLGLENSSAKIFPTNTVLVAMYGATAGKVGLLKFEAATNQAICGILPCDNFLPEFLYYYLFSQTDYLILQSTGGAQPNISQQIVRRLKVPIPSLEIQKNIVIQMEREQALVDSNHELIEIFQAKIDQKIAEVWGE